MEKGLQGLLGPVKEEELVEGTKTF